MQGRFMLAPVILLMALGFIGADLGHAAQIQSGRVKVIAPAQRENTSAGISVGTKSTASIKKVASIKKKVNKRHAASSRRKYHGKSKNKVVSSKAAKPSYTAMNDIDTLLSPENSSYKPYDPWLAYEMPETYVRLTTEARLRKLRLSIVESAYNYVGTPYVWGGTNPDGFDCSGFVKYVYEENGIRLSRTSGEQAHEGSLVSISELRPGDLIFFNMNRRNRRPIDHVGLYLGEGHFIHAPSKRSRMIRIENLENTYYLPKVVEARRVVDYMR
ncbi:MAG TPA: NlpC/P60 family protein [Deltaproteobacteria bacterium]|nr:NlpC/P60 family protein [Deltaproteobacteria bacterium]